MTDTPMTPDRLAEYRALIARTTNAGALVASPGVLRELLAEVDRLRARVAELEALKPARFQDCQTCGAGYEYGQACSQCEFKKQIVAETAARPTGLPMLTGRARHDARVAAETAPRDLRPGAEMARRMLRPGACDACGDIPDEWCPTCAACRTGCYSGHNNNPCTHPNAPWNKAATP